MICVMVFCALTPLRAIAETSRVQVSAFAPITRGDVAGAQSEAVQAALEKGIVTVLGQVMPERTYDALEPLIKERVLPKTELFITNYQIVSRDVSDLAYTVHISATVDTDLLRKNLAQLGVIKEPGSPPLSAMFITVDAPVGLDHVKSLGMLAQKTVASILGRSSLTVIPPPDDDGLGFRVIRPPQAPEALVSEGLVALADLSVGVLYQKNGEAVVTGSAMTIPMKISLQAVDVQNGTLVDVGLQETDVMLGKKDGALLSKGLEKVLSDMAVRLSATLRERYLAGETSRYSFSLIFEGRHDSRSVRIVLDELLLRLGEGTSVIPAKFMGDRSIYKVWSKRTKEDITRILSSTAAVTRLFNILEHEDGVMLGQKGGQAFLGVHEFGEEVTFYRRLPVPGVDNPEDIRKIEYVSWQEAENNSDAVNANAAPVGMSILGRIDPSRDHDIFRFRLPEGTSKIYVRVEQAGPGEVQPLVRVFTGDGRLIDERRASLRGRNVYFTVALEADTTEILLSVEDHLGRYSSMFPYVLTLGVEGKGTSDEPS